MSESFIQLKRSADIEALMQKRPTAFCLLAIIAKRARRTSDINFNNLETGECFIGDYQVYGVTRQQYRSDVVCLLTLNFITIQTTNKGTIAKLIDKSFFDINEEISTSKPTVSQPATNHQSTTNKNVKKEKNVRTKESIIINNNTKETSKDGIEIKIGKAKIIFTQEQVAIANEVKEFFTETYGRSGGSISTYIKNLIEWLNPLYLDTGEVRTIEVIKAAIKNSKVHPFWGDKITLAMLFRTEDTKGNPVDRVSELACWDPKTQKTDRSLLSNFAGNLIDKKLYIDARMEFARQQDEAIEAGLVTADELFKLTN